MNGLYAPSIVNLFHFKSKIIKYTCIFFNITKTHCITLSNFDYVSKIDKTKTTLHVYDNLNMKFNEYFYTKLFSNFLPDHDYIMINSKDAVQQTDKCI